MSPSEYDDDRPIRRRIPGWKKNDLIIDLAKGEKSLAELGAQYGGVSPQAIVHFRDRHQHRIDDVLLNIQSGTLSELSALWIADKAKRIAMHEHLIDRLEDRIESRGDAMEESDVRGHTKVIQAGLRHVAEELGELPTRMQVDTSGSTSVTYKVEGVDPSDVN